jgi:hypothetical protein
MPNLKVSDNELQNILNELENDLSGYLSDTQNKLAKAREEDGSPSPGASPGSPSASAGSPSASASASPSASAAPSAEEGVSPDASQMGAGPVEGEGMEGAPEGEMGGEGMEGAPEGMEGQEGMGQDPAAEQGIDPQALEAEYAQLPVEELKAHYLAAKSALFQVMGQQQGGGQPQGAAPAGPPGGAPPMGAGGPPGGAPPPEMGAPPAMKNEKQFAPSNGGGDGIPTSNGLEVTRKSEVSDLRAQLEAMAKVVNLLAGQPVQKAVTGLTYMGKGEPVESKKIDLDPRAVTAKLTELTRNPGLKKSDRERITGYYEGTVKIDAIVDLLS